MAVPFRKKKHTMFLSLAEKALDERGIGTEWFRAGNKPVHGCLLITRNKIIPPTLLISKRYILYINLQKKDE